MANTTVSSAPAYVRVAQMPCKSRDQYAPPDGRRYGQCCHEPIEHPFRIDTNSSKDIVFDHDASGFGTKMPTAPRTRIEFQTHGMVAVAGAARQD